MSRLLLLVIIVLFAGRLSAQPADLLQRSYADRFPYMDSLRLAIYDMDSATAMQTVAQLADWAQKQGSKELYYQFTFLKLEVFAYDFTQGGADETYLEQVKAAERKGYDFVAADGYHRLGIRYWNIGRRTRSMEYALKAYDIYKQADVHRFPLRVNYQHQLALKYYIFTAYEKTKYYLLQLATADTTDLYHILGGGPYNTLALAYQHLGQLDSAMYCFRLIYDRAMDERHYRFAAVAAGNVGGLLHRTNRLEAALPWLKKEQELKHLAKEPWPHANDAWTYLLCADIYQRLNRRQEAIVYADSAMWINNVISSRSLQYLQRFYRLYARVQAGLGNTAMAYSYLDSAIRYKDSVTMHYDRGKMQEAEQNIADAQHELELQRLKHRQQESIWARNFIIVLISFLLITILLIINRQRLRLKKKQVQLEKEKAETRAQLLQFTATLHQRNAQLEEMQEQLQHLTSGSEIAEKNRLLAQLQQSTILTDDQWEEFRRLFEKVHTGYIARVKEQFRDITPGEIRYMVLVKLNMTNKEMANVLGISSSTIRNYKHRMSKKFNLGENDDLEQVIKNI